MTDTTPNSAPEEPEITYEAARDELVEICLLYTSPSPRDRG